jgi:hypothetical protein
MERIKYHLPVVLMSVITFLTVNGCIATRVHVPIGQYAPQLKSDWGVYKGKRIYLMNFDNQANDTSIWYYYSKDSKFQYGTGDTIHNYFWYAVRNAFSKIGMAVSSMDNPDPSAPAMWLTLRSITDEAFVVRMTVQERGITTFSKEFSVSQPPLKTEDRSPVNLERRAYVMTNRLVEKILADPQFKKTVAGKG